MIIAGPGTGKTRVLCCRIIHLLQNLNIAPKHILAVTFTNKAAQEMQSRLSETPDAQAVTVCTFHALGYTILREQLGDEWVIIDQEDKERLLLKHGCARKEIRETVQAITGAKQQLILPQQMADERLGQIYWDYQNTLADQCMLDLDDLIFRSTRLLRENLHMAQTYRDRFVWIMIDEYQDVNYAQYQLVCSLCPASDANLCVVGDPNQAVYGFRGAHVKFIQRFQEDWPIARQYQLKTSYRCPQSILQASQQVVRAQADSLLTGLPSEVKLQMVEQRTDRSEAEFVARSIEQMIGGLRFFSMDSDVSDGQQRQGISSLSDFAVLCRTSAQMAVLEKAFFDHSIPYQRVGQDPFFWQAPIASILNVMRSSLQPENALLRERLSVDVNTDLCGQLPPLIPSMSPDQAVRMVVDAGLCQLDHQNLQVEELLALCADFQGTLQAFLRWADLATGVDTYRAQTEQVALMTLHASKGLEFPCVFVVGCEDGLLPYSLFADRPSDPDEERRLLYVGMTRAQHYLYLSWAQSRVLYGKKRQLPKSPFLDIIERELIEQSQSRHKKRSKKQDRQLMLFD
jgi:DNA helicase II / ATP-dependent DNA helicase PcrA